VAHQKQLEQVYFNQVHHVDIAIGKLKSLLQRNGLWDETIVFLVSDHGESLFDDGFLMGHGTAINEVMTHCLAVVRNSSVDLPSPMSHYHLRRLIRRMLTESPQETPQITKLKDRKILHYLGWLTHPYRIGSYSATEGRIWFDFRNNRAYQSHDDKEEFLDLEKRSERQLPVERMIHQWEYLQYIHR
jgi:hypothetical protein